MEQWKDLPGFEGKFVISEAGNVQRIFYKDVRRNRWGSSNEYTVTPMPMRVYCCDGRYLSIRLSGKMHMIHRLVAKAFVPNADNKPFVNHKDGNKLNNHYSNLEWCTNQENMNHAVSTGLLNYVSAKKLTPELVKEIRLIPRTVSSIKVAKQYKVNSRTIRAIRLNQTWRYL